MNLYGGIEAGGQNLFVYWPAGRRMCAQKRAFQPLPRRRRLAGRWRSFGSRVKRNRSMGSESAALARSIWIRLATYGFITTTPKPGWAFTDVVHHLEQALQVPVAFDTDVNGAALENTPGARRRGLTPAYT